MSTHEQAAPVRIRFFTKGTSILAAIAGVGWMVYLYRIIFGLGSVTNLNNQYPVVSEQVDLEVKNFKALQSRVVSARIESNRLSTEIGFLKEEHQKLLDLVEGKHLLLDDLFRRFTALRSSFEFVSGETGFAQDLMTNVEGLLNKALMQKKLLNEKITSSEESMEKLLSEFDGIVRKGKTEFYRSI